MKIALVPLLVVFAGCTTSEKFSSDTPESEERAENRGTTAQSAGLRGREARKNEPAIRFARSRTEAEAGTFFSEFKLLAQRDIAVEFAVPRALLSPGANLAQFEVLNPDGVSHSSKWYAFTTEEGAPAMVKHPSFGIRVPVQRAQSVGNMVHFFGKIPVAGTNFTRYRLHGEFTATLRLGVDGAEPSIVQVFEVTL